MLGQTVQIRVAARLGKDRRISLGELAAALAFKRARDGGSSASDVAAADKSVDEGDQVVWETDGDLRCHTETVPSWDVTSHRDSGLSTGGGGVVVRVGRGRGWA